LRLRQRVERRAPARHGLVMPCHLLEPLARNVAPARDVVEERPDLRRSRRPAEGDQQHRVEPTCSAEGRAHRAESAWTMSTSAFTCSTGVDSSTPWPRLKMWPGRPAARRKMLRTAGSNVAGGDSRATGSRLPCT